MSSPISIVATLLLLVIGCLWDSVNAFAGVSPLVRATATSPHLSLSASPLPLMEAATSSSSSSQVLLSAATLDPTTFLSDLFSGLINTPAILAVPIVAALAVAGLWAALIIGYANPTEDED